MSDVGLLGPEGARLGVVKPLDPYEAALTEAKSLADKDRLTVQTREDGPEYEILTSRRMLDLFLEQGAAASIPSGIPELDQALGGGLPVRQVTSVLGYAGVGKSEVARQFRNGASAQGYSVVHVDIELGAARIAERRLAELSGIAPIRLRDPESIYTASEIEDLSNAKSLIRAENNILTLSPGGGIPITDLEMLLNIALRDIDNERPALVIFDSAQRLSAAFSNTDPRIQVTLFMWWSESFARRNNVAVLLVSEQSRAAGGGMPSPNNALTSGAESRALEFVSDVLLALVPVSSITDEIARESDISGSRVVSLLIGKNRPGGSEGYLPVDLVFEKPYWRMKTQPRQAHIDLWENIAQLLTGNSMSASELARKLKRQKKAVLSILRAKEKEGEVKMTGDGRSVAWIIEGIDGKGPGTD